MAKALSYKLALLGCASTCLIGVAHADVQTMESLVTIELLQGYGVAENGYADVTCGSEERYVTYQLTNDINADDNATIGFSYIEIEDEDDDDDDNDAGEDDFPHNYDLVKVKPDFDNQLDCYYINGDDEGLEPGESCTIRVQVNPEHLDCGETFPNGGAVNRDLVVIMHNGQKPPVEAEIQFNVTAIGSLSDLTIVADELCSTVDGNGVCVENELNLLAVPATTVNGDVAITGENGCHVSEDILIQNDTNGGNPYCDDDPIAVSAEFDLEGAINTFLALQRIDDEASIASNCVPLDSDFAADGPITLNPGAYCIENDPIDSPYPAIINYPVTMNAFSTGPVVLIVDFPLIGDNEYALKVNAGGGFILPATSDPSNAENIYIIVDGNVEMVHDENTVTSVSDALLDCGVDVESEPGPILTGNLLTTGRIEIEDAIDSACPLPGEGNTCSSIGCTTYEPVVNGRLLALDNFVVLDSGTVVTPPPAPTSK